MLYIYFSATLNNNFPVKQTALFYGLMVLLGHILAFWKNFEIVYIKKEQLLADLFIAIFSGLLVVLISRLLMKIDNVRNLSETFANIFRGISLINIILIAIFSGFGEEILFRGGLQQIIGPELSTLIFALLHIGPSKKYLWWTFFALLVGSFFSYIFIWRGTLITPIIMHAIINGLNINYLSRYQAKTT